MSASTSKPSLGLRVEGLGLSASTSKPSLELRV
jgi:hypothetical protein